MQILNDQWGREYRLTYKNLETGLVFDITGLRVEFDVELYVDQKEKTNRASVTVYNLKEETFKDMDTRVGYLVLRVGYKGNIATIAEGDIVSVATKRNGADRATEFEFAEGFRDLTIKKINTLLPEGASLQALMSTVAQELGLKATKFVGLWTNVLFPYGYPVYGNGRQVLDEICRSYDLEWKIIDNTLFVTDRYGLINNGKEYAYVLSKDSGLIDIPYRNTEQVSKQVGQYLDTNNEAVIYKAPSLKKDGTVRKTKKCPIRRYGVRAKALINPQVKPNTLLKLVTDTDLLEGYYRVRSVIFKGDTRGNEWYMDIYGDSVEGSEVV